MLIIKANIRTFINKNTKISYIRAFINKNTKKFFFN